jgi:hypothetical protein
MSKPLRKPGKLNDVNAVPKQIAYRRKYGVDAPPGLEGTPYDQGSVIDNPFVNETRPIRSKMKRKK